MEKFDKEILESNFLMAAKLYSFIKEGERIHHGEVINYKELEKILKEKIYNIKGYSIPTFNIYPSCNGGIIIRFIRTKENTKEVRLDYIGLKFWNDFQNLVPNESKGEDFNIKFLEKNDNNKIIPYNLNLHKSKIKKIVDPYIVPGFNINDLNNKELIKKLEELYKFIEDKTGYKYKSFIPNKKGYTTFIPFEEIIKNPEYFSEILDLKEYNKRIFEILNLKEILKKLS